MLPHCGSGTVSAAPGGSTIDLTGGSVAASATCTVSVNVTSATLGAHVNTIPAGNVTSAQGATNASAASATLTVENAPNVTLSKTFTPSSIVKGRTSVLEITVANQAAGSVALTGLALSDTLARERDHRSDAERVHHLRRGKRHGGRRRHGGRALGRKRWGCRDVHDLG